MISSLTIPQVQHILKIPKDDGLHLLSKSLGFGNMIQDDLKAESFVDFHYDVLQLAAVRGLPWKEVVFSVQFANSFFQHLVNDSLPQIIQALHTLAVEYVLSKKFSVDSAKKLVEYLISTYAANHRLYQFVFINEQECQTFSLDLVVETPVNDMNLKDAQPYAHWDYKQKIDKVHHKEQASVEMMKLKEDTLNDIANKMEMEIDRKIQDKEYDNDDLEFSLAEGFLSGLADFKVGMVKKSLSMEVEKMKLTADNAIAVKGIPVPPSLENNAVADQKAAEKNKSGLSSRSRSRSPRSPRPTSSASSKKK